MFESRRRTAGPKIDAHSHGIQVDIEDHCLKDMFGWCRAATTEVSGFGLMKYVNQRWRVYKVFFPEQKCSTGYTWIGGEAGARLDYSLNKRGLPSWERRFWWHTHYNFGTFWSGTDDDQAQAMAHQNGEYSLSLVINQKGDSLCRMDLVQPIPVMVDNITVNTVENTVPIVKRNYKNDIRKWVSPYSYQATKTTAIWKPKSTIEIHKSDEQPIVMGSKYIFYKKTLMTMETYSQLQMCECKDNTCIDCLELVKPSYLFDEVKKEEMSHDYGD